MNIRDEGEEEVKDGVSSKQCRKRNSKLELLNSYFLNGPKKKKNNDQTGARSQDLIRVKDT